MNEWKGAYFEILEHNYLPIPLQHAEDLPAFGDGARAGADLDMDCAVGEGFGDVGWGGHGREGSEGLGGGEEWGHEI